MFAVRLSWGRWVRQRHKNQNKKASRLKALTTTELKMRNCLLLLSLLIALLGSSSGFVINVSPIKTSHGPVSSLIAPINVKSVTRLEAYHEKEIVPINTGKNLLNAVATSATLATSMFLFPQLAAAAQEIDVSSSSSVLGSAIAAYGHYLFFGIAAATLVVERVTIQPNMSKEQETKMVIADAAYGISAALILLTGYFRVTQYGKGWDFYSHEPLFWVKMWGFMILGASSLFPTVTLISRAVAQQKMEDPSMFQPMSDKLVKRMTSVLNAELLAIFSIPFLATTMSRGIFYTEAQNLPVEVIGPVVTGVLAVVGGIKYLTEALSWSEEEE